MVNVICLLTFTILVGKIPVSVTGSVKGNIIGYNSEYFLVNFTEGLKKYDKTINPNNFNEVLIEKNKCARYTGVN